MKKVDKHSADLVAENIEKLKSLFPGLITEGPDGLSDNVDTLKALADVLRAFIQFSRLRVNQ